MTNIFQTRLSNIFDRCCIGRGSTTFRKVDTNENKTISAFFNEALSDFEGTDYSSIKNILNFAQTYYALGTFPDQSVINRILTIVFIIPAFTPQLTTLFRYLPDNGWLYNSIAHCLKNKPDIIINSLKRNDPIWNVFVDIFNKDFQAKKRQIEDQYQDRKEAFLIEVFILYWPLEKKVTNIIELAQNFVNFCKDIRTSTSISLLQLVIQLFPDNFHSKDYQNLIPVGTECDFVDSSEIIKHLDPETGMFVIN